MNADLPTLHDKASELLVRNLFHRVRDMRSGASHISPSAEALTGIDVVCTDTPQGFVEPRRDIASCEGPIA